MTPPPSARHADAFRTWSLDLWRHAAAATGNVALSPISLLVALDMTRGGAKGATHTQLSHVLQLPIEAPTPVPAAVRAWVEQAASDSRVTLSFANRLYADDAQPMVEAFLQHTLQRWGAPIERVDFRRQPEAVRMQINRWVAERTHDRITELVPPGGVHSASSLALVNALYFKAPWLDPFERTRQPRDFQVDGTRRIAVPTLRRTSFFRVLDAGTHHIVQLPYVGRTFAMVLWVPKKPDGLAAVESSLDLSELLGLDDPATGETLALQIPEFHLQAPSIDVSRALRRMGAVDAFDASLADFTAMSDPPKAANRLAIGAVFHQATVQVDEEGTVAAAGSAVMMTRGGGRSVPRPLVVDRPFLFAIEDTASHTPLFLGRVTDPRAG